jgi:branched-subunit amino acid ABC-type transport system permease component
VSTYVLFLLLGLGAGSVYALLGLGMVLKYRSTGVVDFAQGAVAMWGAYVFLNLRNNGTLQWPWISLPHATQIRSGTMPVLPALAITLVYGTLLGLIIFLVVYRPLLRAAPLTKVCASIGVTLAFEAVAVLNFGTTSLSAPPILPSHSFRMGAVTVPSDRLYLAGIVVVVAAFLTVIYQRTRFGLATRAGAENEVGASLIGISSSRIAAQNWLIATVLATLSGVLITPISSLDPSSYTLFVVPALGAVLIGRFQSFWITATAALLLGIVQSELIKLQTVFTWLPQQGLADGVPFVIILVTMTLSARRLGARGTTGTLRNPSLGRPTRPVSTSLIMFIVGFAVLVVLQGAMRAAYMSSIITMCLALSLVVLTGYVGQVSLAQMSFAGVGAFVLTHLTGSFGVPFPISLIVAALLVVPLGVLIGLPALRVRGVTSIRPVGGLAAPVRDRPGHLGRTPLPPGGLRRHAAGHRDLRRVLRRTAAHVGDRPDAGRGPVERARGGLGGNPGRSREAVRLRLVVVHRGHRRRSPRLRPGHCFFGVVRGADLVDPAGDRLRRRHRPDRRSRDRRADVRLRRSVRRFPGQDPEHRAVPDARGRHCPGHHGHQKPGRCRQRGRG